MHSPKLRPPSPRTLVILVAMHAALGATAPEASAAAWAAPIQADGGEIPPGGTWGRIGGDCTRERPCSVRDFVVRGGDERELVLMDGIYRGRASMVDLPPERSGSPDRWLVVRAENDGRVLVDGGLGHGALRVQSSFTRVEGIDFRSQRRPSAVATSRHVDERVHDVVLRRIVAYKDPIRCDDPCKPAEDKPVYEALTHENVHVLTVVASDHVLLEDVAAFGRGRKVVEFYKSTHVTARRLWARQDGNWPWLRSSNHKTLTAMYRSHDSLVENALVTVGGSPDPRIQPPGYADTPQIFSTDSQPHLNKKTGALKDTFIDAGRDPFDVGMRILDSIVYNLPSSTLRTSHGLRVGAGGPYPGKGMKGVRIDNVVVWLRKDSRGFRLSLNGCDEGRGPGRPDGCDWAFGAGREAAPLFYDNVTLRGGRGDGIHDDWVRGSNVDASRRAERGLDIYTPGGPGASICFRRVDGELTDEPLWPWPMQDRIEAATRRSLWETADVEAELASIFAPVPAVCRR